MFLFLSQVEGRGRRRGSDRAKELLQKVITSSALPSLMRPARMSVKPDPSIFNGSLKARSEPAHLGLS